MSTELAKRNHAFEPVDMPTAERLCTILVASKLLPKHVATAEAAFAIIATGRELGLTAMQSLRAIHIIEGKPSLSADLMLALCKSRRDVCEYVRLVESTNTVARYETKRVGEPAATTLSFTLEDAKRAGVTSKDNWQKYPAAMLRARAGAAICRAVYPDLTMGIYDPDELGSSVSPEAAGLPPAPVLVTADGEILESQEDFEQQIESAVREDDLCRIAEKIAAAASSGLLSEASRKALGKQWKLRRADVRRTMEEEFAKLVERPVMNTDDDQMRSEGVTA